MSRIILSKHDDGSQHVVVGWDHPARGAFWQEFASAEEIEEADHKIAEAERTGDEPYSETVRIYETGVKRDGGMWPGIPLEDLYKQVPEDLRYLLSDKVMLLLKEHREDPDSGYRKGEVDLSHA